MHKHVQRKRIQNQEQAKRFHLSRPTIDSYIEAFNKIGKSYDPYDIDSVFDFYEYLQKRQREKINAIQGVKDLE